MKTNKDLFVEVRSDEFHSIDSDYDGQIIYHEGEKVHFGNPDSKHHGMDGIYRGCKIRDGEDVHFVELV